MPAPLANVVWVPPINWGRHLVGLPKPERVITKGRTGYREPNMAQSRPRTTRTAIMLWERTRWVDPMASLSNFRDHVPGDIPTLDNQQPAPSTYMTVMYNKRYTLSTTHYQEPTDTWLVHGTDSPFPADYAPPPHSTGHDTYTRQDEPDDPNIWGKLEEKLLELLSSIRSDRQGLARTMYCLAKRTQRSWWNHAERWAWQGTLCP